MFFLGLSKALYIQNVHRKRKPYESFSFATTQTIEVAFIMVPLIASLLKLRMLKTKYGQSVHETKLSLHFSIAVLLQILFIFDFMV